MDVKELLGEELYMQLMDKLGSRHRIAIVSDGRWIPKDKFNALNMSKKRAEAQLMEREAELEELRKIAASYALLRQQIAELQASS